MADIIKLKEGERAQRKLLITVAEWEAEDGDITIGEKKYFREILGARTEDSTIEFNPDTETSTDILGTTYTDVNKTEPQQDFDPMYLLGGSKLGAYLVSAALENDINAYNQRFNMYIITAFITNGEPTSTDGKYKAIKHKECTILPTGLGGDTYTTMNIEVHFSNKLEKGTVDVLTKDFVFTQDV